MSAAPERVVTAAEIREWCKDPVEYSRRFLRHRSWSMQRDIMRSVYAHERTAVKGCHASSKTFTAADIVLHWITHDPRAVAVTTAPTWKQVVLTLWGEIGKAIGSAIVQYPPPGRAQLWMARAGIKGAKFDNYAIGISTNEADRFQGLPRLKTLIVLDESPGVKPPIWEAIEGIRAGGDVRLLALGNPTYAGGPFHEAFTTNRQRWSTFTIDALDTPNTRPLGRTPEERLAVILRAYEAGDESILLAQPVPYLVNRKWIGEKWHEWGVESPQWEARCRGQFPTHSEYAAFPLAWLERAEQRDLRDLEDTDPEAYRATVSADLDVGIDPAGPGRAECACTAVKRYHIHAQAFFGDKDPRGRVAAWLDSLGGKKKIRRLKIDTSGIGYFFAQHFRDLGYEVHMINAEGVPVYDHTDRSGRRKFADRKAEIYWNVRDLLESDELTGLTDQKTVTQLSLVHWLEDSKGRIMIEPKDVALRDRGVPSPDRAESLILALAPVRDLRRDDERPPMTVIRSMR